MLMKDMIGPSSASSEKEGKTKEMPGKSDPHKHYILQTGQSTCHDTSGRMIDCGGSGQDADFRSGVSWPEPRFEVLDDAVLDRLTGLIWTMNATIAELPLTFLYLTRDKKSEKDVLTSLRCAFLPLPSQTGTSLKETDKEHPACSQVP